VAVIGKFGRKKFERNGYIQKEKQYTKQYQNTEYSE
jgi:hypothetical protein